MGSFFRPIRSAFVAGLIVLAPVAVTVFVIGFLVRTVGEPMSRFLWPFIDETTRENAYVSLGLNILSTFVVLLLIVLLGWFSRLFIGRFFVNTAESILDRVPFVRTLYASVKQIVDTFSQQKKAVFQRVVLIEFPRRGTFVIGFLTGEGKGEIQHRTSSNILNIFVPTTPNPTSGYLILVPEEQVTFLDMTVTEGMKLIISGGAVVPPWAHGGEVSLEKDDKTAKPQHTDSAAPHKPAPSA